MDGSDMLGYLYLFAAATMLLALTGSATAIAWTSRDRWVGATGRRPVAGGAFRSTEVTTAPRRQGRRWLVLSTALLSIVWAILTFFLFAPAGALGGFLFGVGELGNGTNDGFWLTLGGASLNAIPLTVVLVVNSLLMVQRTEQAPRVGIGTAIYTGLHHLVLVALGLGFRLGPGFDDGLATFTAAAAAPGLVLAAMIAACALLSRRDV